MQVDINIENIDLSMLNAIKAMLKTKPEIKFKIKKEPPYSFTPLSQSEVFQKWEKKYNNLSKKEQEKLKNELEKDILDSVDNDNY